MPGGVTSERFRLFIAVRIPEPVKVEIQRTQQELRQGVASNAIRWTKPDQFHLTLKFLGAVEVHRVETLISAISEACLGFHPLPLRAQKTGFFPNSLRPRVLWMGLEDEQDELVRLQNSIEAASLGSTNERREESFTPHVTIARMKAIERLDAKVLTRLVGAISERAFGAWIANEIELIRSELNEQGASYTVLARIPLEKHS